MKRIFSTCILAIGAYHAQAQAVITAKLDKAPNDSLVTLLEPYTGEFDTTRIKNHGFTFKKPLPKGGSVYILQIGSQGEKGATLVYLDNGKMNITGKGPYFDKATYTGDSWVKDWQEVMVLTDPEKGDVKRQNDLNEMMIKANKVGDEDALEKYRAEYNEISIRLQKVYREWLDKHLNSGPAAYMTTVYFAKEMEEILPKLGEKATATRTLQRYLHPGKIDPVGVSVKIGEPGEVQGPLGKVKIGDLAPAFSIPDANGKMVSLADFKGRYVFLDFWASWCGPCKPQIPFLKAANDKFKDKNFSMIAISLDSKKDAWVNAVGKHEINWTSVCSMKGWADEAAAAYGASYIPFNVLIGPDGKVLAQNLYGEQVEKKLAEIIK
ncbi:TlpA disulfide reductase family protein [Chitinophaga qingshengii]|uniref:AhpC/TSA family protein n=1 Tax=Chitinophaga qingshengii TaxID=1569794 RepID=A0ABR7TT87_9BACT|nr:TlpA disulfide reductase family protein [Chitinophaga qingshengii]MBC9932832.1 AhpC/TSA family protein [Chitinophaga qingshengii]